MNETGIAEIPAVEHVSFICKDASSSMAPFFRDNVLIQDFP
jgi:hypothetical protein